MIIAKQTNQSQPSNEYFELFQPAKGVDLEGNEIDVLQSIGSYSIAQLEQEKTSYQQMITSIEEKITAINNLK